MSERKVTLQATIEDFTGTARSRLVQIDLAPVLGGEWEFGEVTGLPMGNGDNLLGISLDLVNGDEDLWEDELEAAP